jgi:cytochrome c peroxidase
MKKISIIIVLTCSIATLVSWTNYSFKPKPVKLFVPKGWPKPLYNLKNNALTEEGIALGKKLFYDERLSKDSSISCASCHQQFAAFSTYEHNLSHGYNNSFTSRNAPALQNLAWMKNFMQDGGINHLDVQPIEPITNEHEMNETLENIILKLKKDSAYKKMFTAAFGNNEISTQKIMKALSQFELTLISANSKYDKVMRGEASFILPEQLGYAIFKKKCVSCHKEPFFTDFSYRNIGEPIADYLNDEGRKKITNNKTDSLKFRVPSLRNVAVTAPYGHDGRFFSLYNVFEHYRKNMQPNAYTDSIMKNKLALSNYEIGQLTAFLYTLTDSAFLKNPAFAPQGYTITPTFIHNH